MGQAVLWPWHGSSALRGQVITVSVPAVDPQKVGFYGREPGLPSIDL